MNPDSPIALVTGATSGFGEAIAKKLSHEGYRLIICGRRKERLDALKDKLPGPCHALTFDVRSREEVQEAMQSLPSDWRGIQVLVNNAGLAWGRESIQDGVHEKWESMIDTNVKGVLYVTESTLPFMRHAMGVRTIINLGSIAGKQAYAGGNVYSATKYAIDGLTQSMRIDLLSEGIRVGQIAPGAAQTEFSLVRFDGDQEKADSVYVGFSPLQASDIADAVFFMVSRPPHVCINDMVIMPSAQANATSFHRTTKAKRKNQKMAASISDTIIESTEGL
ncbi:MAG: SDR family NAD(P)-dependent oxidoreductase [Flavobacteriales bacterium]